MLTRSPTCLSCLTRNYARAATLAARGRRGLLTLAIESSCDDTSVAVLETCEDNPALDSRLSRRAHLHYHKKITSENKAYAGIHPLIAVESHQTHLGGLVEEAIRHLPSSNGIDKRKPDFVSVTRGPGMLSSLNTGLNTAKGLAAAWQIPLLGVNHMQAHALTPRLVSALESPINISESSTSYGPAFPFFSLLVSGGHTMLVHSKALDEHRILANTVDIAIGDAIDKMAREILPPESLEKENGQIVYGRLLETFAFPQISSPETNQDDAEIYSYTPPQNRGEIVNPRPTPYDWTLPVPMPDPRSGGRDTRMAFSFSGLDSSVRRICRERAAETATAKVNDNSRSRSEVSPFTISERRYLARECQRIAFEHLASRVLQALEEYEQDEDQQGSSRQEEEGDSVSEEAHHPPSSPLTNNPRPGPDGRSAIQPPSHQQHGQRQHTSDHRSASRKQHRRYAASSPTALEGENEAVQLPSAPPPPPGGRPPHAAHTLVVSGGVASNAYLRHLLPAYVAGTNTRKRQTRPDQMKGKGNCTSPPAGPDSDTDGVADGDARTRLGLGIRLVSPPAALCTDNAAMIAWAGIEMWRAGWQSQMSIRALRKWAIDATAEDGGILGVDGWVRRKGV